MIIYLTYNDAPSGIFSSQVIDVVKFIRDELNTNTRLISFISVRDFYENRRRIKNGDTKAIVLPMFPGVANWKRNTWLLKFLCLIIRPEKIISRSVLATHIAMRTGLKKVVYDGRGAIAAEWKEYGVIIDPTMLSQIDLLEQQAVLNSAFRIAVSEQLLAFWRKQYSYAQNREVIIPCTLNKAFEKIVIDQKAINETRKKLGLGTKDIVFFYSGSLAGWQSFDLLYSFVKPYLQANKGIKLFFLAEADEHILKFKQEFPEQILHKKVAPVDVPGYLMIGDYGLLIREESITNQVASPVKFAEYLACGLNVIISENLGDYSNFVVKHHCGYLYTDLNVDLMLPLSAYERNRNRELALGHFTKIAFIDAYKKMLAV